jgi:hypothetical protein
MAEMRAFGQSPSGECPWCGFDLDPELKARTIIGDGDSLTCPGAEGGCGKSVRLTVTADLWLSRGEP